MLKNFLVKSLHIKPEETQKFTLLFFHSFFVGLFIAFYFVQANSVFISNYGSEQLPYAYMAAGLVGYFISSIYSHLQQKINSKYLFFGTLFFMFAVTLVGRIGFNFVEEKYLSFFIFIWAWPFISLAGIESGGITLKLLNLIQVKRLYGLINMGGVIASILGYVFIPVLTKIIGTSYNLLFFGTGSLMAAMVLIFFIFRTGAGREKVKKVLKSENKTNFRTLIKDKYFKLIFLSATFSMTVIYIADYGFLSGIKAQGELFEGPGAVANFLALVYAGLKVGELLISYFSSRILSKYGVKLGLTIMPVTLTIIIAISLISGFTLGVASVAFLVLMTLNKSMERILRRGLDDPAFNILYQPLPANLQMAVQSKVGVVMQFAIGIAGIILLFINTILKKGEGYSLEYYPVFFIPILLAWVFIAWRLYKAYKNKLREILRDLSKKEDRETSKYLYGTEVLTKKFKKFNENVVNLSVTILSETNPRIFEPYASGLLKNDDIIIKKAILRSIDPTWRNRILRQTEQMYEEEEDEEVQKLALRANYLLDFSEVRDFDNQKIDELIKSNKLSDNITLIKYLANNRNVKRSDEIILKLLDSKDKLIKSTAIRLAVNVKSEEVTERLIKLLEYPAYYHISTATILDIGERTLMNLKNAFDKTDNIELILKIVEIYAKMGSKSAKTLLVQQLNYPDRNVQLAVIWALFYCKYQAPEEEEHLVKDKILDVISNLLWVLLAIEDIESEKNSLKLFLALDQERTTNLELLFNLLSFLHDPKVINLIKKNIIGKNTIYALELIDNFVQGELKPYIVPVFDDISVSLKIKKLSKFYPHRKMNYRDRLRAIITLEFDKIDNWTVAKALEMLEKVQRQNVELENMAADARIYEDINPWTKANAKAVLKQIRRSELPDEVFLTLFHSDELIYSTAAKIIFSENPAKCLDYLKNMSTAKQKLMHTLETGGYLLADKVKLLRRYHLFFSVPDYLLVKIAKIIEPQNLKKDEKIFFRDDSDDEKIFILLKGEVAYTNAQGEEILFSKKVIITPGVNIAQDAEYLTAERSSLLLVANRYRYFNLLVDNTEIMQHIFEVIQEG